jgi:hypothetical protein
MTFKEGHFREMMVCTKASASRKARHLFFVWAQTSGLYPVEDAKPTLHCFISLSPFLFGNSRSRYRKTKTLRLFLVDYRANPVIDSQFHFREFDRFLERIIPTNVCCHVDLQKRTSLSKVYSVAIENHLTFSNSLRSQERKDATLMCGHRESKLTASVQVVAIFFPYVTK